jgi:hypothetical protein
MITANEYGQIWLAEGSFALLSVKATELDSLPPIQINSHVSGASLSLYLTVEEARAVIAQLEAITDGAAITEEVAA